MKPFTDYSFFCLIIFQVIRYSHSVHSHSGIVPKECTLRLRAQMHLSPVHRLKSQREFHCTRKQALLSRSSSFTLSSGRLLSRRLSQAFSILETKRRENNFGLVSGIHVRPTSHSNITTQQLTWLCTSQC